MDVGVIELEFAVVVSVRLFFSLYCATARSEANRSSSCVLIEHRG